MSPGIMERARPLTELVRTVSQMRDSVGMLSITVGIEPGASSGRSPSWEIAVENDLTRLAHDRSLGPVLARRSAETSARLTELLDPTRTGWGRALYVRLGSGESHEVTLQRLLPTGARVGPAAHVLPLLAALDGAEPAGLLSASRNAISVLESELGVVRAVEHIELEPTIGDWWPEMKGPARANPARGMHVVSHRDRYARRLAAAYRHTLDEATRAIHGLAHERSWARAVLAGDPRTIGAVDAVLRADGVATTTMEANLEGLRTEDALGRLEEALATLVTEQRARLVDAVVGAANAACGLVPVLAALAEGRVDRLLIETGRTFPGLVGSGETLTVAEPNAEASDLADLIVSRALATDAAVTPLEGDAAGRLAASEGIAALLRW